MNNLERWKAYGEIREKRESTLRFWEKLDRAADSKDACLKLARLLRQGYEKDLEIPCGCAADKNDPDLLRQLYLSVHPEGLDAPNSRYMLCYTSAEMADSDSALPEPWQPMPLRFVIDNALNKPSIAGLIFNQHKKKRSQIIPKALLGDASMMMEEFKRLISSDPDLASGKQDDTDKKRR